MENRRHPRLHLRLPIRFIVEQPETRDSQTGEGMLKDISYGGILFQVEPPLPVQPGHIREFSFFLTPDNNKQCDPTHFFGPRGGGPVSFGAKKEGCDHKNDHIFPAPGGHHP